MTVSGGLFFFLIWDKSGGKARFVLYTVINMASANVAPASGIGEPGGNTAGLDRLPDEMNNIKLRDDKVDDLAFSFLLFTNHYFINCFYNYCSPYVMHHSYQYQDIEPTFVDGNGAETGHIIVSTIGGKNGQPKQVIFGILVFILCNGR